MFYFVFFYKSRFLTSSKFKEYEKIELEIRKR